MAYSCFGSSAYSCFGGPAVAYTPMFNGGLSCQTGIALPAPPPVFDSTPGMIPPAMGPPATIPFAPPEAAPGLNPQNTGFRPTPESGTALVSNGATARATVVVRLPADARLFAESKPLNLTGSERKFVSPELPMGQEFVYRFRVEYEREGESVSVTKKVAIRAGGQFAVEFTDLTAKAVPEKTVPEKSASVAAVPTSNPVHTTPVPPVVSTPQNPAVPSVAPNPTEPAGGSDRAMITVKLPPGATLFVDDRKSPSNDPVRRFNTPPLPAGRDFAYLMRAEIVRNGQTESFTQKVPFRAGERVEVDFTSSGR
ncbi:MAG: TIGR03000 domain-containing protein [Gemmataceae bacterium]